MASASQHIPQDVWDLHKDTIFALRYEEELPLDVTKKGGRNIMQVMRDEYQFDAKVSQYEAQFKRWKCPRNLKKDDWDLIIPLYEKLENEGRKPRVKLGGRVLKKRSVNRARYDYIKRHGKVSDSITKGSSQARAWVIEVCQADGQITEYSEHERGIETELSEMMPHPALIQGPAETTLSESQSHFVGDDADTMLAESIELVMPETEIDFFSPTFDLNWTVQNSENIRSPFNLLTGQNAAAELEFLDFGSYLMASPQMRGVISPLNNVSLGVFQPRWELSKDCINWVLDNLRQMPALKLHPGFELPDAQTVLDKLVSLVEDDVFEEGAGDGSASAECGSIGLSEIGRRIIFTLVNNIVGQTAIPAAVIIWTLRADHEIRRCLQAGLRSSKLYISRPLASNLLRAAIEVGDEEVVRIVLETTLGKPNEIDLNRVIATGDVDTPISLACRLYHSGIGQMLIEYGAKASLAPTPNIFEQSLSAIFDRTNSDMESSSESNMAYMVSLLLDNGAKPSKSFLWRALENKWFRIFESLIHHIPRDQHCELFRAPLSDRLRIANVATSVDGKWSVLSYIVAESDAQIATRVIRYLVSSCQRLGCTPFCLDIYAKSSNEILYRVIRCQIFELTEYLLQYTVLGTGHLVAAIRSRDTEMIDLILDRGVCTYGQAVCSRHPYALAQSCQYCGLEKAVPTTPLAEAIILQDSHLVKRFEGSGSLSTISRESPLEVEALVLALAAAGDLSNIGRFLREIPAIDVRSIEKLIKKGIRMGQVEITKTLVLSALEAEAGKSTWGCPLWQSEILRVALEMQNREIVDIILKYCYMSCWKYQCTHHKDAFLAAVNWGERSVVECLLQLGLYDRGIEQLRSAIASHNIEIIDLIIENGCYHSSDSLLAAVGMGDKATFCRLLQHGADPANGEAFAKAISSGHRYFLDILLDSFVRRHPDGRHGFGESALLAAVELCDVYALDALLTKGKVDVNMEVYKEYRIIFHAIRQSKKSKEIEAEMISIIHRLIDAGADLERDGTALQVAIEVNNLEVARLLVDRGADVHRPARRGLKRTPLQCACEHGNSSMVEFLLAEGAEVNAPPAVNGGATALQLAAIQGSVKILRLLLSRGAEIHAPPAEVFGRTALEGAAEHGRVSNLRVLLEKGAGGNTEEEMKSARAYAAKQGHRGCEEMLTIALFGLAGCLLQNG